MARPPLHLIVPTGLHAVSEAGIRIRDFLQSEGLDDLTAFEVELAVVEVITNVVRHGWPYHEQVPISVLVEIKPDAVKTTIEDPGAPPPMRRESRPQDPLAESGRGIEIIYAVTDEVEHAVLQHGNVIVLTKRLRQPAGVKHDRR